MYYVDVGKACRKDAEEMIATVKDSFEVRKGQAVKIEGTGDSDGMYDVKDVEPLENGLENMIMQKIEPPKYNWLQTIWYTTLKWFRRGPLYMPPFTKFDFPLVNKPFPDIQFTGVSLVSEDQLVDENCRIFQRFDKDGNEIE